MAETAVGEADAKKVADSRLAAAFEAWFSERFGRDFCAVYDPYVPDTSKVDF
jgi:hypothetical protein